VAVDPDVCCLARYLGQYAQKQETPEQSTLYAMLTSSRGYLVAVSGSGQASVLRTFLMGSAQERTGLLVREMLVTTALADAAHPVSQLSVFDAAGGLRTEFLQEGTGLKVSTCDPAGLAGAKPGEGDDSPNAVDLALACGAALAPAEKADSVNFRNDHMPYLGKKRRQQNAVRLLSISVTMLLLAVGVYVHSQLILVSKQRESLRDKLEVDYLMVLRSEKKLPTPMKKAIDDLDKFRRRLQAEKTGTGASQGFVPDMLTLVLRGLNTCARQTDLNVISITITATNIVIVADTSSRPNTLNAVKTLREIMKKEGVIVGPERTGGGSGSGRDTFTITAEPAKPTKGA
jgi:hypothetical protein